MKSKLETVGALMYIPQIDFNDPDTQDIIQTVSLLLKKHMVQKKLPTTLFHYTDSAGLKGIVLSGELRATHVAFMNDASEYMHAVSSLASLVELSRKTSLGHHEKSLLDDMSVNLATTRPTNYYPLFVACFSEEENSLSQWRGYGRGEGAFSIGFSYAGLLKVAGSKGSSLLFPVMYDPAIQQALLQELLVWALQKYSQLAAGQPTHAVVAHRAIWMNKLFSVAALIAPMMKNESFKEENEWRLVRPIVDLGSVGFTAKATGLTPYASIRAGTPQYSSSPANPHHIDPLPDLLPITSVWSGPGRLTDISLMAAEALLQRCNYSGTKFKVSSIPYRII